MNDATSHDPTDPFSEASPVSLPATIPAGAPAVPIPGLTEEQWREARARLDEWRGEGEKFVRENPGRAVLYALGAGFFMGLLFRR